MSEQESPITWRGQEYRDWAEVIEEAQGQDLIEIGGADHQRVPYGAEAFDLKADQRDCGDCSASKGQLHVFLCDQEECPSCHGQLLSCAHGPCAP